MVNLQLQAEVNPSRAKIHAVTQSCNRSPRTHAPARPPRAPGPGARNEAILQAGVAIFGSVPYDEVSVDDIAARAGVAHGLVFHYFQNKRGLYLWVLRPEAGGGPAAAAHAAGGAVVPAPAGTRDHQRPPRLHRGPSRDTARLSARRRRRRPRGQADHRTDALGRIPATARRAGAHKAKPRGQAGDARLGGISRRGDDLWLEHDVRMARARIIEMGVEVLVAALTVAQGKQRRHGRIQRTCSRPIDQTVSDRPGCGGLLGMRAPSAGVSHEVPLLRVPAK